MLTSAFKCSFIISETLHHRESCIRYVICMSPTAKERAHYKRQNELKDDHSHSPSFIQTNSPH